MDGRAAAFFHIADCCRYCVTISAVVPREPFALSRKTGAMFDYYRFRYSIMRGWNPEFGYELMAPAGVLGSLLILSVSYLTTPDFGFLMWRSSVPLPGKLAFGIVLVMLVVTYIADDLKRIGLWIVLGTCLAALVATVLLTVGLSESYAQGFYYGMVNAPSPILIGSAFSVYLLVMLFLTLIRLRQSTKGE